MSDVTNSTDYAEHFIRAQKDAPNKGEDLFLIDVPSAADPTQTVQLNVEDDYQIETSDQDGNLITKNVDGVKTELVRQGVSTYSQLVRPYNSVVVNGAYVIPVGTDPAVADTQILLCNAGGIGFTVTMPSAAAGEGKLITIKKTDNTANAVTVSAADNIDGVATFAINSAYQAQTFFSDGTTWWTI